MNLGTRARNILMSHAGGSTSEALMRFFVNEGKTLNKIPGAGAHVMAELNAMRDALLAAVVPHGLVAPTRTDTRTALERWADRHGVPRTTLPELSPRPGELHVLRYLQKLLTSREADRRACINQELLCAFGEANLLSMIARRHGLSRERVRQLRNRLDRVMPEELAPIADLPGVRDHYAELITTDDLFLVTPELVARANAREGTTWSPLLFQYLAQALNAHRLVPFQWRGAGAGGHGRAEARVLPLVAEELIATLEIALDRARAYRDGPRSAPERMEVGTWMDGLPAEQRGRLQAILLRLLPVYFNDTAMEEDAWVLPPNAAQTPADMLEAVLLELNEPHHVDDILSAWQRHYPDRPITRSAIQGLAQYHYARFFSIGRTSTYGLRRWEGERSTVKGGTIRNIVAEFLTRSDTPVHVDVIEHHVRQYRPGTHADSIRQNVQMDTSGRFILLNGGFIGLADKHGEKPPPAPPVRVKSSQLRTSVFRKFIGKPRHELAAYLAQRSGADLYYVDRAIDGVVAAGRLTIDAKGFILAAGGATPGHVDGELPFTWST